MELAKIKSEILPNIRIKIQNSPTETPNDFQIKTELLTAYRRFTSFSLKLTSWIAKGEQKSRF